jgi:hypothetical protein
VAEGAWNSPVSTYSKRSFSQVINCLLVEITAAQGWGHLPLTDAICGTSKNAGCLTNQKSISFPVRDNNESVL